METMTPLPVSDGFTRADLDAMRDDSGRYELIDGVVLVSPRPDTDGFTRADLDAMRDDGPGDGRRYELIDGVVVVTPSATTRHQDIVVNLTVLLRTSRPQYLKVLVAPFDVALAGQLVIEPDLVVGRRGDFSDKDLPAAPVLTVEVLSPSTRWVDEGRKREILAAAGCPSYWLVDPGQGDAPPTLTVLELEGEAYIEVARVRGDEAWTATKPFPVTVVPSALLDD